MSLDTNTIYLVATMIAALLGFMLVFFGYQENIAALKWWGAAYLLGSAAVAIWTIYGDTLGPMTSLALTSIGFFACGTSAGRCLETQHGLRAARKCEAQ